MFRSTGSGSSIVLYSQVDIITSNCREYDFRCLYRKTDRSFSDNNVSCYTPNLPNQYRTSPGINFVVSLRFPYRNSYSYIECSNSSKCTLTYSEDMTPELISIYPQNFYLGQYVQFRFRARGCFGNNNSSLNNAIQNFLSDIQIGSNTCIFASNYNIFDSRIKELIKRSSRFNTKYDVIIKCIISDGIAENIPVEGLNFRFITGKFKLKSRFWKCKHKSRNPHWYNWDKLYWRWRNYLFRTYPFIFSVDPKTISETGGTLITIKGLGFQVKSNGSGIEIWLQDDQNICDVVPNSFSFRNRQIQCITRPITPALKALFLASNDLQGNAGLRYTQYTSTNCSSTIGIKPLLSNLIPDSETVVMDGTSSFGGSNYLEYFDGWFLAPSITSYRFFVNTKSPTRIYITKGGARLLVIDAKGTVDNDWVYSTTQIGPWFTLNEKLLNNILIF